MSGRRSGSIQQKNGRWYYVMSVTVDGKRTRPWSQGFKTEKEARTALNKAQREVDTGTFLKPSDMSFGKFLADEWMPSAELRLKPTTLAMYRTQIDAYIAPELGSVKLASLTTGRLDSFYGKLSREGRRSGEGGLSPRSVRIVHVVVRQALQLAVKRKLLSVNPADDATLPEQDQADKTVWSPAELRQFLDSVADDRPAGLWQLAATTGLRRGELLGLRWDDLDLDAGKLAVRQNLVVTNYQLSVATPKTKGSRRTISLDAETVAALRAHRRRQVAERLGWGEAWTDTGHVFVREDGEWIHPERLTRRFDALVRAAGLPRITLHGVRHSILSAQLAAGVPIHVVSKRAGHASPSITLSVYAHAFDIDDEAAAEVGAKLLAGGRG